MGIVHTKKISEIPQHYPTELHAINISSQQHQTVQTFTPYTHKHIQSHLQQKNGHHYQPKQ